MWLNSEALRYSNIIYWPRGPDINMCREGGGDAHACAKSCACDNIGREGSGIFICAENVLGKILEKCYL